MLVLLLPGYLQAYGAGAYLRVGVVLQRALLVCWTVCLPVVLLWSQVGEVGGEQVWQCQQD